MADITQTPANVVPASTASLDKNYFSGEAIDAGDMVYINTTDGLAYQCDSSTAAKALAKGMATNSAPGANQPIAIATEGDINPGGTMTIGESYFVSSNSGKLQPSGDVGSSEFVTFAGIATTATNLKLDISVGGIAHA